MGGNSVKEELTSRERVRLALNHQETDRIPLDLGGTFVSTMTFGAHEKLVEHLQTAEGLQVKNPVKIINRWGQTVQLPAEILQRFKIDTMPIYSKPPRFWRDMNYPDGMYVDEWGVLRKRSSSGKYHYYDVYGSPLADAVSIADLERFRWPNGKDPGRIDGLREEAEHLFKHTDYALVGNLMGVDILELFWFMRGYENSLMDLLINQDFAHTAFRKLLDIQLDKFTLYLGAVGEYLDVVVILDDLSTQNSLFFSPDTYRTMLKPYHRELIAHIKSLTRAKLLFHCCGAVRPLLPDLIEIGVDIIQPVQVSAKGMDTQELKAEFGDKICFWGGGCDSQQILPRGSEEDVRKEVQKRIDDLSPGGGFVFSPVHNVQFDVPSQNVVAMYDHAFKYGSR